MSNILNDRNELLEAVKAPDLKKKQPSNFGFRKEDALFTKAEE